MLLKMLTLIGNDDKCYEMLTIPIGEKKLYH